MARPAVGLVVLALDGAEHRFSLPYERWAATFVGMGVDVPDGDLDDPRTIAGIKWC